MPYTTLYAAQTSRGGKRADVAQNVVRVVEEAIGEVLKPEEGKEPPTQAPSALGASRGGTARAEKLSPERRKETAKPAAK
jgi:hypothetical protein